MQEALNNPKTDSNLPDSDNLRKYYSHNSRAGRMQEYVFSDDHPDEIVDPPDEDLVDFYRERTAAIKAKGFLEVPSEVIEPFDNICEQSKVVRFENFVKEIRAEDTDSEDSFHGLATSSSTSFPDPVSEDYEPKHPQPLQLIGKHLDVVKQIVDKSKENEKPQGSDTSSVTSSNVSSETPALTVTKIYTDKLHNSASSMTITMIPKRTEIAKEQNEIIAELFAKKQEVDDKQVLRNYFQRWFDNTTTAKIVDDSSIRNESRQRKINQFLQTIRDVKKQQLTKEEEKPVPKVADPKDYLKKKLNTK